MQDEQIHQIIELVKKECSQWPRPSVTVVSEQLQTPFTVLVSCIISLRTRDAVTTSASARLFEKAATAQAVAALSVDEIAELIYPAGFYRVKAGQLQEISRRLLQEYDGVVPDTIEELTKFKGVGRKTANLVVTLGYGKPGICVDIHVHRITNRWGYVQSKNPDATEMILRRKLPPEYWILINDLLVSYGQNRCFPTTPACSLCPLTMFCSRVGVTRSK